MTNGEAGEPTGDAHGRRPDPHDATEAVARLRKREIRHWNCSTRPKRGSPSRTPGQRAADTLFRSRADHAKRLMAERIRRRPASPAGSADCPSRSRISRMSPACARPMARRSSRTTCQPLASAGGAHRTARRHRGGKSNTPEFGAGGSTFNEVFGRTRNPGTWR